MLTEKIGIRGTLDWEISDSYPTLGQFPLADNAVQTDWSHVTGMSDIQRCGKEHSRCWIPGPLIISEKVVQTQTRVTCIVINVFHTIHCIILIHTYVIAKWLHIYIYIYIFLCSILSRMAIHIECIRMAFLWWLNTSECPTSNPLFFFEQTPTKNNRGKNQLPHNILHMYNMYLWT